MSLASFKRMYRYRHRRTTEKKQRRATVRLIPYVVQFERNHCHVLSIEYR